jgi:hypothetical protein
VQLIVSDADDAPTAAAASHPVFGSMTRLHVCVRGTGPRPTVCSPRERESARDREATLSHTYTRTEGEMRARKTQKESVRVSERVRPFEQLLRQHPPIARPLSSSLSLSLSLSLGSLL